MSFDTQARRTVQEYCNFIEKATGQTWTKKERYQNRYLKSRDVKLATHTHLSSVQVKNAWRYTFTAHTPSWRT
jgi:hypothetical protein